MHIPALLQFLKELAENNNRPWFLHNKPNYDILREEFIELVGQVGGKVAKFDKELGPFEPKKAVFRIYRDVRFAKDKSPYKNHIGAVLGARTTDKARPIYYFHVDHQGNLLTACGVYMPEPSALKKIRDFIVAEPKKFAALLKAKSINDTFGGLMEEDRMSRPPKGYAADLPHIDYIKNRHFLCETSINLNKRVPKDLAGEIAKNFEAAKPLIRWLREALAA
jgi:uncharacterized protein (TIGR02453 family)